MITSNKYIDDQLPGNSIMKQPIPFERKIEQERDKDRWKLL